MTGAGKGPGSNWGCGQVCPQIQSLGWVRSQSGRAGFLSGSCWDPQPPEPLPEPAGVGEKVRPDSECDLSGWPSSWYGRLSECVSLGQGPGQAWQCFCGAGKSRPEIPVWTSLGPVQCQALRVRVGSAGV